MWGFIISCFISGILILVIPPITGKGVPDKNMTGIAIPQFVQGLIALWWKRDISKWVENKKKMEKGGQT